MRHLGRYLPLFHLDVLSTTSKDKKARFRGLWNSNGGMYET